MKKTFIAAFIFGASVMMVSAQTGLNLGSVNGRPVTLSLGSNGGNANGSQLLSLLNLAQTFLNRFVPFLVGLAIVVFFWYLVTFIWKGAQDPEAKNTSLKAMMYSILAIFVMVSIWGIITFMGSLTGIGQGGGGDAFAPQLPGTAPTQRNVWP